MCSDLAHVYKRVFIYFIAKSIDVKVSKIYEW